MHYLRGLVGCSEVGSSEEAVANHGTQAQAEQTRSTVDTGSEKYASKDCVPEERREQETEESEEGASETMEHGTEE